MSAENEEKYLHLRAIHIDLVGKAIVFEAEDRTATKLVLTPQGILYQLLHSSPPIDRAVDQLTSSARDDVISESPADFSSREASAAKQKSPTVTLTGRLKSLPKEGRPDAQGHPTAWARFAAHEEGYESGHLYLATFHRASRRIALALAVNDQITVEGYSHPSGDPMGKRLDTLSIFRLLHYPGQPEKSANPMSSGHID
jgi:hypothetical protein